MGHPPAARRSMAADDEARSVLAFPGAAGLTDNSRQGLRPRNVRRRSLTLHTEFGGAQPAHDADSNGVTILRL